MRKLSAITLIFVFVSCFIILTSANVAFSSVAGKYVSEKNDNNYMVLKADRSFFIQERSQQMHGEYDIDGNIIILKMGRGRDAKVRIEGNVLIDPDGDRWIKKLEETERP